MNPSLRGIFDQHNEWVENFVGNFEHELQGVVASAEAFVISELRDRLEIVDGAIARTPANQRILRQVDDMLVSAMDRAGYGALAEEFAASFPGQLPYLDQMIAAISHELKTPLEVAFTKADEAALASQQISTVDTLQTVVESMASVAKRKALFSFGAMKFGDVAASIATTFSKSIGEASTLAATSTSMFFRTMQDRTFQKVENGLPQGAVKYRYDGPNDKLTRDFCVRMLERSKSEPMTRDAIEKLDNGQLPNPYITGGGYQCRHQWIVCEIKK